MKKKMSCRTPTCVYLTYFTLLKKAGTADLYKNRYQFTS